MITIEGKSVFGGRESYIVPFAGAKGKCEAVYDILREKVRTDEE